MKLSPGQLESAGFVLQDKLEHNDILPFIRLYLKKPTLSVIGYIAANLLFLLLIILTTWYFHDRHILEVEDALSRVSYGIGMAFLLIPLHEYIHALAYKAVGAKHTSYDMNLRKFYFMAIADHFVANRSEFRIVALAPFTIITIGLLVAVCFVPAGWKLTILGTVFTHAAFCSGDFGLLSYFEYHKHREVVTYDDKSNNISYFYTKDRV